MKKNKTTYFLVLFFFMGLFLLLYPFVSNFYNQRMQSKAIVDYDSIISNYDENQYAEEFQKAEQYNEALRNLKDPFYTYDVVTGYEDTLNVDHKGMIGHITISKIKLDLPIYHGTSDKVLSKGVGHLEGSSLPIGGIGTHSVLSAHRGLPSSTLFTNLDKLELQDTFVITVLNQTLTYEIDQILIVEPNEIQTLELNPTEDYVTLMTCTPYGINTHRLLIRGKRIENEKEKLYVTTEAFKINNFIVTLFVAIPIILLLLGILFLKPMKKNKKIKEKFIKNEKNRLEEKL